MKFYLVLISLVFSTHIFSQTFESNLLDYEIESKGTLTGKIVDFNNENEPLAFANISVKNLAISKSTNLEGKFNFKLKAGIYAIAIRFTGYKTIHIEDIEVKEDQVSTIDISLSALKFDSNLEVGIFDDSN